MPRHLRTKAEDPATDRVLHLKGLNIMIQRRPGRRRNAGLSVTAPTPEAGFCFSVTTENGRAPSPVSPM